MASEQAHDLLYVIEDMVQDRREDHVSKQNLKQQMKTRKGWNDTQYDEAETELIRSGAVVETLDGERLQVHRFEL